MSDYASTSSRPGSPIAELPNISTGRPYRFNWDSTPKRSGPGSVSETTEGRGDYFAAQGAQYDLDTPATATLPLGSLPPDWSSSTHGFHAISTVVNHPHKRSAPPKAHSSLPAVPPADLPRVRRKDFDVYLRAVSPEWERFEKNVEQGREGAAQISGPPTFESELEPTTPRTPRPPPGKALPPLESVPDIYFDPKFNLGDPRTFNTVTDHYDEGEFVLDSPESFAYSQPILDKLSSHADIIEQHLVREISARSTSFFAALANLQDLQAESEQCLDRISNLRTLLKEVDEKSAMKGLEIVRLESKLRNLETVREGAKAVGGVVEMMGIAKSLVTAGQWGEALDVLDGLDTLWNTSGHLNHGLMNDTPLPTPIKETLRSSLATVPESPLTPDPPQELAPHKTAPTLPISSLQAFAYLPSHLHELNHQVASSLTSEILNILRLDLVERIDAGDDAGAVNGAQMSLTDRLRPLLHSLVRTNGTRDAILAWRDIVLAEVRNTLKRHIPAFDLDEEDGVGPKSSEAVTEVRSLDQSAFMDLARIMYQTFLNCIEGLQAQSTIMLSVLEGINTKQSKNLLDIGALKEDLADILSSAGELANARAAKVINVRSEQHTALDLPSFHTLFTVSWDFVVKSEVICRRMIVGLRGAVVSQSKSFIQAYHQARLSQSAKLVEDEQWGPAEVPQTVQNIVNLLVDASIRDPSEFLLNPPADGTLSPPLPTSPVLPSSPGLQANGGVFQPSSPLASPKIPSSPPRESRRRSAHGPGKHLKIEDRNFYAVSATLEILVLLADYLRVIVNLPTLATETMSRTIELMKAVNSRMCQVVLGAGAMRSAGLKNITAKHLALASQSLSIMISLIPYVREAFRRHLNPKQAVMLVEFDKLKRDYQEHQNEIHAKLIAIMGDRLSAHIRSLQNVRWDIPKEGGGVNDYMELLVKETVTLHKVLSRYLSVSIVEYVMTQVFAAINHRLSEEYAAIDLPSIESKERLLADARFLHEKLSGLKNVRAPTAMLEIVVQEKSVNRPVPVSPTPAPVSTPSRFSTMFSRSDSLRARATTPTQEATAAVASPSPDPSGMVSPLPPIASDSLAVPTENGNGGLMANGLVDEPGSVNGASSPPPIPPKTNGNGVSSRPTSPRPNSPIPPSELLKMHQMAGSRQSEDSLDESQHDHDD